MEIDDIRKVDVEWRKKKKKSFLFLKDLLIYKSIQANINIFMYREGKREEKEKYTLQ